MSAGDPARPIAVQSAEAARHTRFDSSSGTPDVRHLSAKGPGRVTQRSVSCKATD